VRVAVLHWHVDLSRQLASANSAHVALRVGPTWQYLLSSFSNPRGEFSGRKIRAPLQLGRPIEDYNRGPYPVSSPHPFLAPEF
jgi:hypothetical protein